jgi:hypothetical protein
VPGELLHRHHDGGTGTVVAVFIHLAALETHEDRLRAELVGDDTGIAAEIGVGLHGLIVAPKKKPPSRGGLVKRMNGGSQYDDPPLSARPAFIFDSTC